jgi:hypothetical protein
MVLLSEVQLSTINCGSKILNGITPERNNFMLCTVLSSLMKSHAVLLHPAQEINHPFILHIHTVYTMLTGRSLSSHQGHQIDCHGVVVLVFT